MPASTSPLRVLCPEMNHPGVRRHGLCHVYRGENVRNSGLSLVRARGHSPRSTGKLAPVAETPKTSQRFSAGSGFESLMAHKTPGHWAGLRLSSHPEHALRTLCVSARLGKSHLQSVRSLVVQHPSAHVHLLHRRWTRMPKLLSNSSSRQASLVKNGRSCLRAQPRARFSASAWPASPTSTESWCVHARHLLGACRWATVSTHRLVLIKPAWSSFNPLRVRLIP